MNHEQLQIADADDVRRRAILIRLQFGGRHRLAVHRDGSAWIDREMQHPVGMDRNDRRIRRSTGEPDAAGGRTADTIVAVLQPE